MSFARSNTHRASVLCRRQLLQAGYSAALGPGLSGVLAGRKAGAANISTPLFGRAKSVIFIFLTCAPSHQDIWAAPGVQIGPHVPRLAAVADKFAVVRSMTHSLSIDRIVHIV